MEHRCTLKQGRIASGSSLAQNWDETGLGLLWDLGSVIRHPAYIPVLLSEGWTSRNYRHRLSGIQTSRYSFAGRFTTICLLLVSGLVGPWIGSQQSWLKVIYPCGYPYNSRMNGHCDLVLAYTPTWVKSVTSTQFSLVILWFMRFCVCKCRWIFISTYDSLHVCII